MANIASLQLWTAESVLQHEFMKLGQLKGRQSSDIHLAAKAFEEQIL